MKKNKLIIATALAMFVSLAIADEDQISYSLSVKAWNQKFKVDGSDGTTFNPTAPIISGTARKGDYFVSGSFMFPTSYSGSYNYIKRQDTDISFGWTFTPGLSAIIGYKILDHSQYDDSNKWLGSPQKDTGLIAGLTGAKPLDEKVYVSGSFGYAPNLKNDVKNTTIKYTSAEVGLGYIVDTKTQLTVGYRDQSYKAKQTGSSDIKIGGFIFGMNYSF
jgi:hypothetical protein